MKDLDQYFSVIHNSNPKLEFCECFDDTSSLWNFSSHSHPYIELIYYLGGKGDIELEGTMLSFSMYDTTVYPVCWEHRDGIKAECRREIICLWLDIPELVLSEPIQLQDRNRILGSAFKRIYEEAKREESNPWIMEYNLKYLLMVIFRERSEMSAEAILLNRVLQYIDEHYAEKITLDELAELEHISKSYLSRRFKEQTGMSAVTYINRRRIEEAQHTLLYTNADIGEIAYRAGFESPKYFHRVFKKMVGVSPTDFRRLYRNKTVGV